MSHSVFEKVHHIVCYTLQQTGEDTANFSKDFFFPQNLHASVSSDREKNKTMEDV